MLDMTLQQKKLTLTLIATSIALAGCALDDTKRIISVQQDDEPLPANLLFTGNRLGVADLNSPADGSVILGQLMVADASEQLVSIDRRPQNGQLYALGFNAVSGSVRLYVVHPVTLKATPLTSAAVAFASPIGGATPAERAMTRFEIDFNPQADRLRVVSSRGENFRMNPNDGTLVGSQQDKMLSEVTNVAGTAYTNSQPNTSITTQYTVTEGNSSRLFIQSPPNDGVLTQAKDLVPRLNRISGLDIPAGVNAPASNEGVKSGIAYGLAGTDTQSVARINLSTGSVVASNPLGNTSGALGLATQRPLDTPVIVLASDGTRLIRFEATRPTQITTVPISGVTLGESLVGVDFRPATGQLFALGIDPIADKGTLYRLDPQSGEASTVCPPTPTPCEIFYTVGGNRVDFPDPATSDYGFDFNPVVDAIRITTSTGLNFRVSTAGAALDGDTVANGTQPDGNINGVTMQGAGAAYTNSYEGTAITTLYIMNSATDELTIQSSPNMGTQVAVAPITVAGNNLNFTAVPGFDIPPEVQRGAANQAVTAGIGYALLTLGSSTNLYRINLVNGQAQMLGAVPATGLRGLTVGSTGNIR